MGADSSQPKPSCDDFASSYTTSGPDAPIAACWADGYSHEVADIVGQMRGELQQSSGSGKTQH
eukprot:2042347-Alexandrium_andersonii.AAC.1